MYKLCDTCNNIQVKGLNLFTKNDEKWENFPHHLPVLGREGGSQTINVDFGSSFKNRLIYYFSSAQQTHNLNLEYPDSYKGSKNDGLVVLDKKGKATIHLDCPQPYKDKGISYLPHVHFLVSNKNMTQWLDNLYTQNVLCNISKKVLKQHMKQKNRLIINALPKEYFEKNSIPGSHNLYYKDAQKQSPTEIKNSIKQLVNNDKNIKVLITKHKLKLEEIPIIVYCYDHKCDAGNILANELMRSGFTNILDYEDGIIGWTNNTNKTKSRTKSRTKSNRSKKR